VTAVPLLFVVVPPLVVAAGQLVALLVLATLA
jgi:hypothetical protein